MEIKEVFSNDFNDSEKENIWNFIKIQLINNFCCLHAPIKECPYLRQGRVNNCYKRYYYCMLSDNKIIESEFESTGIIRKAVPHWCALKELKLEAF